MFRVVMGIVVSFTLGISSNCKKPIDLNEDSRSRDIEYAYVCVDNRLFLESIVYGYKKGVGLEYLSGLSCECIEEIRKHKNFIGIDITDKVFVLKIK